MPHHVNSCPKPALTHTFVHSVFFHSQQCIFGPVQINSVLKSKSSCSIALHLRAIQLLLYTDKLAQLTHPSVMSRTHLFLHYMAIIFLWKKCISSYWNFATLHPCQQKKKKYFLASSRTSNMLILYNCVILKCLVSLAQQKCRLCCIAHSWHFWVLQ